MAEATHDEQLEPREETLPPEVAHHPGVRQYVVVAVVLAVITALEVGLFYVDVLPFEVPNPVVTSLLMAMMVLKFALVALWFMHLRFDSRIYRRLFVTGIILALAVFAVVLLTFGVFIRD